MQRLTSLTLGTLLRFGDACGRTRSAYWRRGNRTAERGRHASAEGTDKAANPDAPFPRELDEHMTLA